MSPIHDVHFDFSPRVELGVSNEILIYFYLLVVSGSWFLVLGDAPLEFILPLASVLRGTPGRGERGEGGGERGAGGEPLSNLGYNGDSHALIPSSPALLPGVPGRREQESILYPSPSPRSTREKGARIYFVPQPFSPEYQGEGS